MEIFHQYTNNIKTKEEWLAFQIWLNLYDYYIDYIDDEACDVPIDFIELMHFDILDKSEMGNGNRHIIISISDSLDVDIPLLYTHMERNGIYKNFINNRTNQERGFLTIWVEQGDHK